MPRAAAPALGAGEYWAEDLEGCAVVTADGRSLGVVEGLRALPSCEVLEVGDLLVPMVGDAVQVVDIAARRIVVDAGFLGRRDALRGGRLPILRGAEPCASTSSRCFPDWFELVLDAAPRRATRWRPGTSCARSTCATHTPLSGGQVDDTPFGGGAGMVLRVDVMDAALRGVLRRRPGRPARRSAASSR